MTGDDIYNFIMYHFEVVVTFLGALVAFFSAYFARRETRRQQMIQTEALRINIDNASLEWGNAAIDTMGRAAALASARHQFTEDAAFQSNKTNLMIALSSLIERGRMFFPNLEPESKGGEKVAAFKGERPPILDALMWAYHETSALQREGGPTGDNSAAFITDCRRLLVSELQGHLDPNRLNAIIGRYDKQKSIQRNEAIQCADDLKQTLKSRRPSLVIDEHHVAVTATETLQ